MTVSPRNHFLFTPLLPSTTVGTLEFRCIIEPVRVLKHLHYYQASCIEINTKSNEISCLDFFNPEKQFSLPYDYLVCSVGAKSNTFNIPGVDKHAFMLKQLSDARAIRNRLMECFERASNRFISDEERQALTTFVIVGGVEFSGELYDFMREDVAKWFPDVKTKIILIESTDHILGSFDHNLSDYAMQTLLSRSEIKLMTNTFVKEVTSNEVVLGNNETIPCGICVWSTGLSPTDLTSQLPFYKEKRSGRIYTNDYLQVLSSNEQSPIPNIFAVGDCATPFHQSLPATAQVAAQASKYLATRFNKTRLDLIQDSKDAFHFKNLGMLAYLGGWSGLADLKSIKKSGFLSWLLWRSVYLTRLVSLKNRILVAIFVQSAPNFIIRALYQQLNVEQRLIVDKHTSSSSTRLKKQQQQQSVPDTEPIIRSYILTETYNRSIPFIRVLIASTQPHLHQIKPFCAVVSAVNDHHFYGISSCYIQPKLGYCLVTLPTMKTNWNSNYTKTMQLYLKLHHVTYQNECLSDHTPKQEHFHSEQRIGQVEYLTDNIVYDTLTTHLSLITIDYPTGLFYPNWLFDLKIKLKFNKSLKFLTIR
ncbi:unnamed protein product [Didymodactylos carnosus]|nr:unnamed protein product [Didymodactylos carnosus]CAF3821844.1 unnamed protein product [Didymodactylos carnosus]